MHVHPFKVKTDIKLSIKLTRYGLAENMKLTFEINLSTKTYMNSRYRYHNTNFSNLKDV